MFGYVIISIEQCVNKTNNVKWKNEESQYNYVDLTSVDIDTHKINNTKLINRENAPSRAQQVISVNDILFGTTRPMLKRICIVDENYDNQICSTGFCVLRPNVEIIRPKWLYYIMSTNKFYNYVENIQKGASYPAITDIEVKEFEIYVPTLKEQDKVISLLDQFESYCNDITQGLPAEIELRQKQYEYYRNKLLTFKEIK